MQISTVNITELPLSLLRNNCVSRTGEGSLTVQVNSVWRQEETAVSLEALWSQVVGVASYATCSKRRRRLSNPGELLETLGGPRQRTPPVCGCVST